MESPKRTCRFFPGDSCQNRKAGNMLPELTQKVSLFFLLLRIDEDLANHVKQGKCPVCGGPLHYSNYPRKPRGGPDNIPDECLVMLSLCCGREECRKRARPASCRFMGRKVYWHGIILLVMALKQQRPEGPSINKLMKMFEIGSRNTILKWLQYYRDIFPTSPQWQRIRGQIVASIRDSELPGELLNYFFRQSKTKDIGLVSCLKLLAT